MAALNTQEAVCALKKGEIIAYPTEAVFGLGCDPENQEALSRLRALKGRDPQKAFILIASEPAQLLSYINLAGLPPGRWESILLTWPGPFTWIFPATSKVLAEIRGAYPTVAVRVTAHPVARALCDLFGGPIVSTSANKSNLPALRSQTAVNECFDGQIVGVVEGELGDSANPTIIQDALSAKVVRAG